MVLWLYTNYMPMDDNYFLYVTVYPQKQQYAYAGYPTPNSYPSGPYYHGQQQQQQPQYAGHYNY